MKQKWIINLLKKPSEQLNEINAMNQRTWSTFFKEEFNLAYRSIYRANDGFLGVFSKF